MIRSTIYCQAGPRTCTGTTAHPGHPRHATASWHGAIFPWFLFRSPGSPGHTPPAMPLPLFPEEYQTKMSLKRRGSDLEDDHYPPSLTFSSSSAATIALSSLAGNAAPSGSSTARSVPYLNSRTRKRHRNGRPNEEIIHGNTLRRLYDAQRLRLDEATPMSEVMPSAEQDRTVDQDMDMMDDVKVELPQSSPQNQTTIDSFFGRNHTNSQPESDRQGLFFPPNQTNPQPESDRRGLFFGPNHTIPTIPRFESGNGPATILRPGDLEPRGIYPPPQDIPPRPRRQIRTTCHDCPTDLEQKLGSIAFPYYSAPRYVDMEDEELDRALQRKFACRGGCGKKICLSCRYPESGSCLDCTRRDGLLDITKWPASASRTLHHFPTPRHGYTEERRRRHKLNKEAERKAQEELHNARLEARRVEWDKQPRLSMLWGDSLAAYLSWKTDRSFTSF